MRRSAHLHYSDALEGAHFVVSAIEVGARESLWRQDYEIPLKYHVRQPYAENGGPGGFIHAARNLVPVMEIVRDDSGRFIVWEKCDNYFSVVLTRDQLVELGKEIIALAESAPEK